MDKDTFEGSKESSEDAENEITVKIIVKELRNCLIGHNFFCCLSASAILYDVVIRHVLGKDEDKQSKIESFEAIKRATQKMLSRIEEEIHESK